MLKLKYYAPAFGWGIFIFILSTLPGKDIPQVPDIMDLLSVDKLVHTLFYAILTWLILRGIVRSFDWTNRRHYFLLSGLAVAIVCAGFGWFLEWYQKTYCQDRYFEILDGIANTIGAFISWISFSFLSHYKSNKIVK